MLTHTEEHNLLSPLRQMLIMSRNILPDTPKNNVISAPLASQTDTYNLPDIDSCSLDGAAGFSVQWSISHAWSFGWNIWVEERIMKIECVLKYHVHVETEV